MIAIELIMVCHFRHGCAKTWRSAVFEIPPYPLWEVRRRPISASNWEDDCHWYILGHKDGRRYRELLISKDGRQVGPRIDLDAHYKSSHQNSLKRRLKKRQAIFNLLLITGQDPGDMSRAYVPFDGGGLVKAVQKKSWGQWWRNRTPADQPRSVSVHNPQPLSPPPDLLARPTRRK